MPCYFASCRCPPSVQPSTCFVAYLPARHAAVSSPQKRTRDARWLLKVFCRRGFSLMLLMDHHLRAPRMAMSNRHEECPGGECARDSAEHCPRTDDVIADDIRPFHVECCGGESSPARNSTNIVMSHQPGRFSATPPVPRHEQRSMATYGRALLFQRS